MRKLVTAAFVSLDGVMQAPGAPEEDPTGGFTLGGWTVNYWDEAMGQFMDGIFTDPFALLLGRKTYEIFAAHWPYVGEDDPIGKAFTPRPNMSRPPRRSRSAGKIPLRCAAMLPPPT